MFDRNKSLWAASIFRNKSLIGVDLRKPQGQALVKTIAAKCDFLIENFRPGSLEAWGLGYDELAKLNPLLLLKYQNSIADAVKDLGEPAEIGRAFAGFQQYLYAGL